MNAIKSAAENEKRGYKSHFIYAGDEYYLYWDEYHYLNTTRDESNLRSVIIEGMKKYNINSAMISILKSWRNNLATKEEVEDHCKGKYEAKNSIHDDLDSFFERLCLGEEPNETARTYFFPKLSEKETKLFEAEDLDFLLSWQDDESYEKEIFHSLETNTDYDKSLEYIRGICTRQTFLIHNDHDHESDENNYP